MKVYNNLEELKKDVKDNVLKVNGDVKFTFSWSLGISLEINGNINASDINAKDIIASDINARDIIAWNINARDINARDIIAKDIIARDIIAWDINAWDISYHAFCVVYNSIQCLSYKARRKKHQNPIRLDGEFIIKDKKKKLILDDKTIEISEESFNELKRQLLG